MDKRTSVGKKDKGQALSEYEQHKNMIEHEEKKWQDTKKRITEFLKKC